MVKYFITKLLFYGRTAINGVKYLLEEMAKACLDIYLIEIILT